MPQDDLDLKAKVDELLQEIRIVLPGTQALLGFEFVAFFNPAFQNLPSILKYLHFGTLIVTTLCAILLVAPVAFQQVGEDGRTTYKFLQVTRKMLNSAMFFLLLALAANIFLAAKIINLSTVSATIITGALLLVGATLWYIYPLHNNR